jgi:hypothetical protein
MLHQKKVPELRKALQKRGLPTNGKKAELIARIVAADQDPTFQRTLLLTEVTALVPEKITLQSVIKLETKCSGDKLAMACLIDVINHASLGMSLATQADLLAISTAGKVYTSQKFRKELLWIDMVPMLRTKQGIYSLWKTLNAVGISPDILVALLLRLHKAQETSCSGVGHGMIPWIRLRVIATPLMTLVNPTVLDLLELIETLRKMPMVSMDQHPGDHALFTQKWIAFLDLHPAVKSYTDPIYTFIIPTTTAADANLAANMALFPPLPGGGAPAGVNDLGGALIPGLYSIPTQADANIITYGLRTHYATPQGTAYAGGASPAQHILMFSVAAGALTQV